MHIWKTTMSPEVISIERGTDNAEAIGRAAGVLADGGVVAFPTETVYGVGVRADIPDAIDKLRRGKQRGQDKPFTVHIGRRSDVERYVPSPSGMARRLIEKGWPGPLTLVFTGIEPSSTPIVQQIGERIAPALYHEGSIGLRCPDDELARALLSTVNEPVVAASANVAGSRPARTADEVADALNDSVDLILDGGPVRYAKPSTVVRLNGVGYSILRPGVYDERTLRRLVTLNILLVCTGNTCRSPMAAAVTSTLLAQKLGCQPDQLAERGVVINSAGTMAGAGGRATREAIEALRRRELDLSSHRSNRLSVELINSADHIFAMTAGHVHAITDLVPSAGPRISTLIPGEDIDDPIGGTAQVYERCLAQIDSALKLRLDEVEI